MGVVVVISNYLVQFPIQHFGLSEILTYGAFSYPITFLITDLANRAFGKKVARHLVLIGFFIGSFFHLNRQSTDRCTLPLPSLACMHACSLARSTCTFVLAKHFARTLGGKTRAQRKAPFRCSLVSQVLVIKWGDPHETRRLVLFGGALFTVFPTSRASFCWSRLACCTNWRQW